MSNANCSLRKHFKLVTLKTVYVAQKQSDLGLAISKKETFHKNPTSSIIKIRSLHLQQKF